jgi:hypothetical protein
LQGENDDLEINTNTDMALNIRVHTVVGVMTKENLFDYLGELYSSPEFDHGMNSLWDLRKADLSSFALPEVVLVRDFVEKNLNKPKALKSALVVASQLDFTLSTMYETLLKKSAVSTKVFFDVDDAKKWVVS